MMTLKDYEEEYVKRLEQTKIEAAKAKAKFEKAKKEAEEAAQPHNDTQQSNKVMTAAQLKALVDTEQNLYKFQWDKKNVVQFKNERIAILKNEQNKQVQFIVAFDQVLKEGYVLIGTADSQDASSNIMKGMGGGSNSVMFYFQKAK